MWLKNQQFLLFTTLILLGIVIKFSNGIICYKCTASNRGKQSECKLEKESPKESRMLQTVCDDNSEMCIWDFVSDISTGSLP